VRRAFAVGLLVLGLSACGGGGGDSGTTTPALALNLPSSYVLKWSDEFSSGSAPSTSWTYDEGVGDLSVLGSVWGNNEKQYYTRDAANVFVSGGELTIQPIAGVPAGAPSGLGLVATSARIKTDTAAYYSALNGTPYGFYEIRAKVPCVAGAWPAIWLMGKDGSWPARGEVDVMEWFGAQFTAQPNQVQSAVHTTHNHWGSAASLLYAKRDLSTMCSQYHRFQLHWSANEILIGVDGVPTFSYKKPSGAGLDKWPFDQPAHLILNVAVGGNLGGAVNTADIPNMVLKVDYVKVWQPVP
jgi:beta-glucanase (GH16 family)